MSDRISTRHIARILAADSASQDAPHVSDRDETISAIAAAIRARARRRKHVRWALSLSAAAALLVAVGSAAWMHRPMPTTSRGPEARNSATAIAPYAGAAVVQAVGGGVTVATGDRTARLDTGATINAGSRVVALRDGTATLVLPSGTRLTLDGGGDLAFLGQEKTQLFVLGAGAVRADVAKLHEGERFLIRTSDAEIEVHGTSFRVAHAPPDASCGAGTTTRVTVLEGVVTVRGASGAEVFVRAGELWPSGCGANATADTGTKPSPLPVTAVSSAPSSARSPHASSAVLPPKDPASALAAQNDMFAQAMTEKRNGKPQAAVSTFEGLLGKYPASPLAESATAERMKLLDGFDRARAIEAAQGYLRTYPHGFSRLDAEKIVTARP